MEGCRPAAVIAGPHIRLVLIAGEAGQVVHDGIRSCRPVVEVNLRRGDVGEELLCRVVQPLIEFSCKVQVDDGGDTRLTEQLVPDLLECLDQFCLVQCEVVLAAGLFGKALGDRLVTDGRAGRVVDGEDLDIVCNGVGHHVLVFSRKIGERVVLRTALGERI